MLNYIVMIETVYKDRVLLERVNPPKGDYLLPEGSEEKSLVGKVVYIGPKVTDTSIGDVVVFEEFEHSEVNIEGDNLILTREESLICKLKANE